MFVYSLKASTIKFFGVICIAVVALVALIIFIPANKINTTVEIEAINKNISFENVKTADDAISFLNQYGWETEKSVIGSVPIENLGVIRDKNLFALSIHSSNFDDVCRKIAVAKAS